MELAVNPIARLVDKFHGMPAITVHEAIAIWNATIAHQNEDLVDGLGILRQVVPEHGRVIGVG